MGAFLVIAAFCIGFPLLWISTIVLLSRLGGWGSLASHYGYSGTVKSPLRKYRSLALVRFRAFPCNYGSIIHMYVDDQALYFWTMKPFAAGHRPLRIPFRDITLSEKKVLVVTMGRLHLSKVPDVHIRMRWKDVEWIESVHGELKRRS